MSLTVVVNARSNCVTMRPAISAGGRPVYRQMAAMTGMRISGKISTGVAPGGQRTDDQEKEGEDDERVRAPQCDADQGGHKNSGSQFATTAERRRRHNTSPPQAGTFPLCSAT